MPSTPDRQEAFAVRKSSKPRTSSVTTRFSRLVGDRLPPARGPSPAAFRRAAGLPQRHGQPSGGSTDHPRSGGFTPGRTRPTPRTVRTAAAVGAGVGSAARRRIGWRARIGGSAAGGSVSPSGDGPAAGLHGSSNTSAARSRRGGRSSPGCKGCCGTACGPGISRRVGGYARARTKRLSAPWTKPTEDRLDALFCALVGYQHWRARRPLAARSSATKRAALSCCQAACKATVPVALQMASPPWASAG